MIETFTEEDKVLVRYLFSELDETEILELEEEMLLDEELSERVEVVEMNLIDGYVRDELTAEERLRFREKFLAEEENREKVNRAQMFHKSLRLLHAHQVAAPRVARARGLWPWGAGLFQRLPPSLAYTAAALLLAGALYAVFTLFRPERTDVVKTVPPAPPPANVSPTPDSTPDSSPSVNTRQTPPAPSPTDKERRGTAAELARNDPDGYTQSISLFRRGERSSERTGGDAITVALDRKMVRLRFVYELLDDVRERESYGVTIKNKYGEPLNLSGGAQRVEVRPVKERKTRRRFIIVSAPAEIFQDGEPYSFEIDDTNTAAKTFVVNRR